MEESSISMSELILQYSGGLNSGSLSCGIDDPSNIDNVPNTNVDTENIDNRNFFLIQANNLFNYQGENVAVVEAESESVPMSLPAPETIEFNEVVEDDGFDNISVPSSEVNDFLGYRSDSSTGSEHNARLLNEIWAEEQQRLLTASSDNFLNEFITIDKRRCVLPAIVGRRERHTVNKSTRLPTSTESVNGQARVSKTTGKKRSRRKQKIEVSNRPGSEIVIQPFTMLKTIRLKPQMRKKGAVYEDATYIDGETFNEYLPDYFDSNNLLAIDKDEERFISNYIKSNSSSSIGTSKKSERHKKSSSIPSANSGRRSYSAADFDYESDNELDIYSADYMFSKRIRKK